MRLKTVLRKQQNNNIFERLKNNLYEKKKNAIEAFSAC